MKLSVDVHSPGYFLAHRRAAGSLFCPGLIISLVLLLSILAAGCGSSASDREESHRAARAAFAEQSRRSLDYQAEERLAGLPPNPLNGFCFLLEESLSPDYSAGVSGPDSAVADPVAFEFPRDAGKFAAPGGTLKPGDRSLILEAGQSAYLTNLELLEIPWEDLSEIEIRLRLAGNSSFNVGLSSDPLADWSVQQIGLVNVPAESGQDFRVYRIRVNQSDFRRTLSSGEPVRRFFLSAGAVPKEVLEVSSIRFLSPRSKFLREPYGNGYLSLGGRMRRGFWMPVPGKLAWEVRLPEKPCVFRSGVGLSQESSQGVDFRVSLENDGEELAAGVLRDDSSWRDLGELDLGRWSLQTITLVIETKGQEANTVFWGDPAVRERPRARFNVVIILEDALRADHLGCYGYASAVTPITDRLAGEGILFETAISQAATTRPSCPSILTSLYPSATGVWSFQDSLDDRFLTLAEVLRNQGFLTAAYIQNINAGAASGLHQGFGEYCDQRSIVGYDSARLIPEIVGRWLRDNADQNFFLYLHLIDPHGPYRPKPPFDAAWREYTGPRTPVAADPDLDPPWAGEPSREGRALRYDGEIAANDHYIGVFLDLLEELGLREDTLVAIVSDHGEFLGEDGRWGHSPPGLLSVLRVPLILSYPRRFNSGERIPTPVQVLDLMPTVLELAGLSPDRFLLQGSSLLPLIEDPDSEAWRSRPIFSEEVEKLWREDDKRGLGSVFLGGKHYLFSNVLGEEEGDWTRRQRTFLLTGEGEVPAEAGEDEIAAAYQLLLDLQAVSAAVNSNILRDAEQVQNYDPEIIRQLKSLGYLK